MGNEKEKFNNKDSIGVVIFDPEENICKTVNSQLIFPFPYRIETKSEYLRECLKRNPNFRRDVLRFHQHFPPVFSRELRLVGKNRKIVLGPGKKKIPEWLAPILVRVGDLFIGKPETLEDLKTLNDGMKIEVEGFRQVFSEEEIYWKAIKKTPAVWMVTYECLRKKWPMVDKDTVLWGVFEPYRPPVLVPSHPFDIVKWKEDLKNLAYSVKIVIPIYEDTSEKDPLSHLS